MANIPPNTFNHIANPQQINANQGPNIVNNSQYNQMPFSQASSATKQDANSNNPPQLQFNNVNNHQSANCSPAFNRPMLPPTSQTSPVRQPNSIPQNVPNQYAVQRNVTPTNTALPSQTQSFGQINANAPPLVSSSQPYSGLHNPVMNGPLPLPPHLTTFQHGQYPPSSTSIGPPTTHFKHPVSNAPPIATNLTSPLLNPSGFGQQGGINSTKPAMMGLLPADVKGSFSNSSTGPMSMPPQLNTMNVVQGVNGPPLTGPPRQPISGPSSMPHPQMHQGVNGPPMTGPPRQTNIGSSSMVHPQMHQEVNGPPMTGLPRPPISGPSSVPPQLPGLNGPPPTGPPRQHFSGPSSMPPQPMHQGSNGPPMTGPPRHLSGPPISTSGPNQQIRPPMMTPSGVASFPPSGPASLPPLHSQPGVQQPVGNFQNRYPPMQQPNQQGSPLNQYPDQYNQGLNQQMGQLSVTKQGFDQLWGHQVVDLLQCKNILPEYPEEPPPITLTNQFADSPNCSPEIFRCTLNRIPETNSLLQKSRLPLGILIHPFKDLNHLPVIQCMSIVRCRACRTYINPFVYFVDSKRWKCNLCFRVNDLPEEFQYDPVSKSYGDPSRRPEIKSATIEFIAPGEYMLRPPQPAVYLFLLDISQLARDSGYLKIFCETLKSNLDQLPGDARTQVGFLCYDAHVHYYLLNDELTRPKEVTVIDIEDIFLPSPSCLLVNLRESRALIDELLTALPQRHCTPAPPSCALGAALQAALKLMAPTGGRVSVFQTCLPNVGPGALASREDPNARSSSDVAHLSPATDFYKRLALDCSAAQVAVDLFLLNAQYSDLATLSGISKFSAGTVYHLPLFNSSRPWQVDKFKAMLTRYITRKIGFEAVMRVRCTRGISIHTFHGNFFVRSTDLLSLPNVSPDAGFGMQLSIDEALSDLQQVCFQAALLYTSSKGERRIRVHTMAVPIASTLTDILHHADQHCIIGLLTKMAVDRCISASLTEAREALMTVAVDFLSALRLALHAPSGPALLAPRASRLLPMLLHAASARPAFRTGTSTRLDDRVADMCALKSLPLRDLVRALYPDLYALHALQPAHVRDHDPDPDHDHDHHVPRLQLSAERLSSNGAYLLDDGTDLIVYICKGVSPLYLQDTWGVPSFSALPEASRELPKLDTEGSELLNTFIDKLNDDRAVPSSVLVLRDDSPSRKIFTDRLLEDRVESRLSYVEFLQHIKMQVK